MDNYVLLNNINFPHTLLYFNCQCWSMITLHAHGLTGEFVPYLTKKTHCFKRCNQGYRKIGNN